MNKINPDDLVIYPTDTVWGIGCRLNSKNNFDKIALIKNTPAGKPLSIMFNNVEELKKYFNFPAQVSDEWLVKFFSLETSLGIPKAWAKKEIPGWAFGGSQVISVRCLSLKVIENLYRDFGGPFYSTSLNISGEPPVTKLEDAKKFLKLHGKECVLVEDEILKNLSGISSTIIFFDELNRYKIIREGNRSKEVLEHLNSKFISA
jgi:L-threonylcarbamoyladenylate synthase